MEDATSLAELLASVEVKPQPWRKALAEWRQYAGQLNRPITLAKLKFLEDAGSSK